MGYEAFSRHRGAKILLALLGASALLYLIHPAVSLYEGRSADPSTLPGEYLGELSSIVIWDGGTGTMEASGETIEFEYTLADGTLTCVSGTLTWEARRLGEDMLWNKYDGTLLRKGADDEEEN